MYPLYELFQNGEQPIKSTARIEYASAKLKSSNLSFFVYYLYTFITILIVTLTMSKYEQEFDNKNVINSVFKTDDYSHYKSYNLTIFVLFEIWILISCFLVYQISIFRNELANKIEIKSYLIFNVINYYLYYIFNYSRPSNETFWLFYISLFLVYNLFTDKNSKSIIIPNMIVSFISLLMYNYVELSMTKVRIALLCFNYLILIPEINFLLIKNNKNMWVLNIIIPLTHNIIFIILGVRNNFSFLNYWGYNVLYDLIIPTNILVVTILFIYPLVFNIIYVKYKKKLRGMWDIPNVTNYY